MQYRPLGRTGLMVSELGFGCGNVGGLMIRGDARDQVQAVARAVDIGINYFDTAAMYGNGQSEINLGKVLNELRPDVYVGTKIRPSAQDLTDLKGAVVRLVEEGLSRLDRECVDLVQLHNLVAGERAGEGRTLSTEDVLGGVLDAFQSLQADGKVRYFGITGLGETEALHKVIDSGLLYTAQSCYNLLNPSAGMDVPTNFPLQNFGKLIDRAAVNQMGVLVIRVLAAGALSETLQRDPVASPSVAPIGSSETYDEDLDRAARFSFLTEEGYVENMVEASLRFPLSSPGVSTVLLGLSNMDQLDEAARYISNGPLPDEALSRLPGVWSGYQG